jgi:MoaA/NifB/PqqE/SkfB family radical SAM enzyme
MTDSQSRLNLLAKLRQDSIWPSVTRVANGERLRGPLVVDFDPTTFCDLGCPECISAGLLNQTRFSRERLIGLSEEFIRAGVKAAVLIGGGEPLAHPGTREVINCCTSAVSMSDLSLTER